MAHPPEKKAQVRQSFVRGRLSLEEAAEQAGVPYPTARKWKAAAEVEGDDWDKARSAARIAADGIRNVMEVVLDDYIRLHQATVQALNDDTETPAIAKAQAMALLADAYAKTMAAVAKSSPQLSRLAVAQDVIQRFVAFVSDSHPEAAPALLAVLEPFAGVVAKEFR